MAAAIEGLMVYEASDHAVVIISEFNIGGSELVLITRTRILHSRLDMISGIGTRMATYA